MKIYPAKENHWLPEEQTICHGIDLGTTYTLFATVNSAEINFDKTNRIPVKFISINQESPNEHDLMISDEKVASMLAIYEGKPYVGNNLYHLKGRDGFVFKKNMFYHWKTEMGVEHFPMYPNALTEKLDMPYKVAGGILNYCRAKYLGNMKQELENTIITVPASFQANQRQDVLKAASLAKIKTSPKMLIDEPNAAFLGYFNRLEDQEKQEWAANVRNKNVLVIDFGGGTLDLSILNVDFRKDTGISIANKAISRYNDLGGQDIDSLIAEVFLYPKLKEKYTSLENLNHKELQNSILPQLAIYGEQLKIAISDALSLKAVDKDIEEIDYQEITVSVKDCVLEYKNESYDLGVININGAEFKELFLKVFRGNYFDFQLQDKSVSTISHSITEIIEKSDLTLDAIDFILYVGGSSFNPFLISLVKEKLQNSKSLTSPEPDKLVAEGAAVFSYFYYVHGTSLISPIISDTIGITVKGNNFFPIIEKGKQLPIEVTLPEFKLQSNLSSEIVVPICINGIDFPIGEIRTSLDSFYDADTVVTIKAMVTVDKTFELKVYIDDEFIVEADFDNPFSIGKVTAEELDIMMLKRKINKAKNKGDRREEKSLLRDLIWKHSDAGNNAGIVETAEEYIKRFDDQDAWIWNMVYIGNSNMGKINAGTKAIKKAIALDPNSSSLIYNYSLVLARNSDAEALKYLLSQNNSVKKDNTVKCKIITLKDACDIPCKNEALEIVRNYKNNTTYFSDFDKRILLPSIFRIANKAYSYVNPKLNRKKSDSKNYLATKDSIIKF